MSPQTNHQDLKALLIGGFLILLVGGYFIGRVFFISPAEKSGSDSPATAETQIPVATIAPDALRKKLLDKEPVALVDIRSAEEYQKEHLPRSLSYPIGMFGNFSPENGQSTVIIFSGQDPQILETAKNILNQKSFPYALLKGGFEAWKESGGQTISAGDPDSFVDQSKITYISVDDLKKLAGKIFLLDVQPAENYQKKHLKGAANIPLSQLEKRVGEIPPAQQIIVYGENELASFQAGVRLSDLNVFAVRTLAGNTHLSSGSGLPLEP